jgi:kinetochore protein Spc25
MAAALPSIDFGFETLKERMSQFTKRFDAFIENGRKSILEEKNEFAKNMAEDKGGERSMCNMGMFLTRARSSARP